MTELFTRQGSQPKGQTFTNEKGKTFHAYTARCGRCGGAGRSDRWAHTGYTCYDCGGNGHGARRVEPLYTAEQLEKLNARKAKAEAKKMVAVRKLREAAEAEAEAKRGAFELQHGELMNRALAYVGKLPEERRADNFIADVYAKASQRAELTEKQATALATALDREDARQALKQGSGHVGKVGERLTLRVTVERATSFERKSFAGYGFEVCHVIGMRDEAGNALVAMGRFNAVKGDTLTIKATVKEHGEWNGEKQTKLQRVAVCEEKIAA
jgi:hypothetical protein